MTSPGSLFRALRLSKGLDLRSVETYSGLSKSFIALFEKDRSDPRLSHLVALLKAIDVSPSAFIHACFEAKPAASIQISES
jgi:transcriptional regulator with XRE-family HTH domain